MSYMKELLYDILEMHELGAKPEQISDVLKIDLKMVKDAIVTYGDDFK